MKMTTVAARRRLLLEIAADELNRGPAAPGSSWKLELP